MKDSRPYRAARAFALFVACTLFAGFAAAAVAQTPLTLFNGASLLGWNAHGAWNATVGNLTATGGGNRYVLTAVPFADLKIEFEYNASQQMGAKLRLWTSHDDTGGLSVDLDTLGSAAGVGGIESLSHSSLTVVAPGWHSVKIEAAHGQLNVRIDGQPSGNTSGLGSRAGYIGFEAATDGTLQIRAVKLSPLGANSIFNGTDLSGWKSIARNPDAKGGVGHDLTKTLTLGIGGGTTKPHEAKWSVQKGSIHGQDGPGGLEHSTPVEDGIFLINAAVVGDVKKENFAALSLRTVPGQLSGGYSAGIGPYAGGIDNLVSHPPLSGAGSVEETIVMAGRSFAIWVNGALTTVHTDTRAENSSPAKGAKTGGGAVTLLLPNGNEQVDVQRLSAILLPKNYGVAAHAPAPPPPAPAPVATAVPVAAPAAAPPSEAEKALVMQQQATAKKDANDQANKQRIASLMSQALATNDPQQQMSAYRQVVGIDPSNAAAVQGFKEAQAKVLAQQDEQQKAASSQVNQQQEAQTRASATGASLTHAQSAFFSGHLREASTALAVAERLSPDNPAARALRTRISSAQRMHSRLYMLGGGVGLVGLVSLGSLWLRRRKQGRFPMLEITRGLDNGRSYPMEKEIIRIGAVAQNGAQKNDIVIQDVEHAISRFHCEVARKNGQLYITDLKSANGTRLNGERLQPGRPELLRRGSTITLANNVDLRFDYDRGAKKDT